MTEFRVSFFKTISRTFFIVLGAVISAAGIAFFLVPHNLLTGGVAGLSMLLSYLTPVKTGVWILMLNIPLFILAWRKIDISFCIYSIIGTVALSAALSIFNEIHNPLTISEPLLAALYGGIVNGGGVGIALRARGSQGGMDIVSVVARKRFSVSIGSINFYMNFLIVAVLALKFNIELGLLTIFSQFVSAKAVDRVVTGLNTAKNVTIVSDRAQEIADYILSKMDRGVTFLDGHGGFGGREKKVIWCVVTTSQLTRIKGAMKKIDPNAFMSIMDASEIVGKGFYKSPF